MPIVLYASLALIMFCLVALLLTPDLFRPSPEAQRILDLVKSTRVDRRTIRDKERVQDILVGIATQLRVRMGLSEDPNLKARLIAAGYNSRRSVDIFFAARLLVPLAGHHCGQSDRVQPIVLDHGIWGRGLSGPDLWLKRKTASPQKPHTPQSAGRARSDGGVRGCGPWTGPGTASHRRRTRGEPSGHQFGVHAGKS